MIYILCVLAGILIGGGAAAWLMLRLTPRTIPDVDLRTLRWERSEPKLSNPALRCLRRHYPTHDLVTGVPLLDLVSTSGPHADEVSRRCAGWSVGLAMVDKKSGAMSRIIVWRNDPLMEEKIWLLRRVGHRVTVIDEDIGETQLLDVMTA